MVYNKEIKIIAFVGLPGAGISTATEYITSKGYPKVYFGGIIYAAMDKAGLEHTPENEKMFRVEIRKREGADFAAKQIIKEIHSLIDSGQHQIVVDGLYTWDEYKTMKHEFPGELTVIAIVTPKLIRHRRLAIRPKRPLTEAESTARDWSEIEDIQKGGPIAIADHYIMNDDSLDNTYEQIDKILDEIGFVS
jgi:dephospho-CoA kinase